MRNGEKIPLFGFIATYINISAKAYGTNFIQSNELKIDNKKIPIKDQIKMLELTTEMSTKNTEENLKLLDKLPKSVYNVIKPTINVEIVKSIIIFMATIYILSSIFGYIQAYSLTTVSNNFAKKLRTDINSKINRLLFEVFHF